MQLTCNQSVICNVASETAGCQEQTADACRESTIARPDADTQIVMDDVNICKQKCVSCHCDTAILLQYQLYIATTPALDNVLNLDVWAGQHSMASAN